MTAAQIIQGPYDSGVREARMGRGPGVLAPLLAELLRANGHEVGSEVIEVGEAFRGEAAMAFALSAAVVRRVRAAGEGGRTPVLLSGNCNSSLGAITGIDPVRTGVIWFDAHGEFNTPETSASGFLDGMGLAVATGRCWRTMAAAIPGFRAIPDANIVLVGARDFDVAEERELRRTAIAIVQPPLIREWGVEGAIVPALAALRERVSDAYVHIDLDVLDPSEATVNPFPASGGLSANEVEAVLRIVRDRFNVRGLGIASYDPEIDRDGRGRAAALRFVDLMLPDPERKA
jgi:arginase